jgi:hypothetical protein
LPPHCPPDPGRHRKGRVAQPHHHLVERHAHHLGRGLGDDRVAAGADVGHVGFDRHDAAAVEPDPRRRLHDLVAAEGRGHAHADQPAAVAHLGRAAGRRWLQPKRSAPVRRQLDQRERRPCEKCPRSGPLRGGLTSGIDLGVVEDAELDRIECQLLGHLVHGDLQRHHAGRLARRAHGVASGRSSTASRVAVIRWRRHRAAGSGCTAPSGLPPGRSPDQLSWPMAVILPSRGRADADPLDGRRPMRRCC